jgi:hypothetical protein
MKRKKNSVKRIITFGQFVEHGAVGGEPHPEDEVGRVVDVGVDLKWINVANL